MPVTTRYLFIASMDVDPEFEDLFKDEMTPDWRAQREEFNALSETQGNRTEESFEKLINRNIYILLIL